MKIFFLWLLMLFSSGAFAAEADSPFALPPEQFKKAWPQTSFEEVKAANPYPAEVQEMSAKAEEFLPVLVEQIDGYQFLNVRDQRGLIRKVRNDDLLVYGDEVHTGEKGSLYLLFEDGAQLLAAPNTELQVFVNENEDGVAIPSVKILKGEMRILVPAMEKVPTKKGKAHYRFLVFSRSGVIGVRGTDFVVAETAEKLSVHMFSGVVDVAPSRKGLEQGLKAAQGEFIETRGPKRKLVKAQKFQMTDFLSEFAARNVKLGEMYKLAISANQGSAVKLRFRKMRVDRGYDPSSQAKGGKPRKKKRSNF